MSDATDTPPAAAMLAAVQAYSDALGRRVDGRQATAAAATPAAAVTASVVDFVYDPLTAQDLAYDTGQYPVSGTFGGPIPPWLNDYSAVPEDWRWSKVWDEYQAKRAADVKDEVGTTSTPGFVQKHVPGQQYAGTTTADLVQQWYTQGMWDPTVFPKAQVDALTQTWIADDAEFARQRLGGANPNVIKAAAAVDYDIAAWTAAADNAAHLGPLQSALSAAQGGDGLYVCDYTEVLGDAVKNQFVVKGRHLAAPICFFTVDSGRLMPAAIQIVGTDPTSHIFTPGDADDPDGDAWLLAKLWAASADQQWWFSGSHLFNTHTIDMLFGIAVLNQLNENETDQAQTSGIAPSHPMVRLAKPFLTQVFDINNVVIGTGNQNGSGIYQKDQFVDAVLPTGRIGLYQVISDLWADYDFDDNAFPTQMGSRGLLSGAITTVQFPYRDDGQVWWDAIEAFVKEVVAATYATDADVADDAGLNAWMTSAQDAFNHDGTTRFTWVPTIAAVETTFSNLLYLCSVQHTGVNDTMLDGWGFTPNGPFSMQAAPPTKAADVTQATVLASLPKPQDPSALKNTIVSQITFVMQGTAGVVPPDTLAFDATANGLAKMQEAYGYEAGSAQAAAVSTFWNSIWNGDNSVDSTISAQQQGRIDSWQDASTPVPNSLRYHYLSAALQPFTAPAYLNAPVMNQIQI